MELGCVENNDRAGKGGIYLQPEDSGEATEEAASKDGDDGAH